MLMAAGGHAMRETTSGLSNNGSGAAGEQSPRREPAPEPANTKRSGIEKGGGAGSSGVVWAPASAELAPAPPARVRPATTHMRAVVQMAVGSQTMRVTASDLGDKGGFVVGPKGSVVYTSSDSESRGDSRSGDDPTDVQYTRSLAATPTAGNYRQCIGNAPWVKDGEAGMVSRPSGWALTLSALPHLSALSAAQKSRANSLMGAMRSRRGYRDGADRMEPLADPRTLSTPRHSRADARMAETDFSSTPRAISTLIASTRAEVAQQDQLLTPRTRRPLGIPRD